MAQLVKNTPAVWDTWFLSLGWEDTLKGKGHHFTILAWRIPWTVLVHGVKKSQAGLNDFHFHFQATLFLGFPRQMYWSGLPFSPPRDLPNPGIEPKSLLSPTLTGRFFTIRASWGRRWGATITTINFRRFSSPLTKKPIPFINHSLHTFNHFNLPPALDNH